MDVAVGLNGSLVCQSQTILRSRGIFYGHSPFEFQTPLLLAQVSLSSLLIAILQFLLTPLGQTAFISQMLGGIIIGPTSFGRNISLIKKVFPIQSFYVSETFAFFGCMLFLFLVGVKMDLAMVRKSGKKAVIIGLSTFFVPLIFNTAFAHILMNSITMDPNLRKSLVYVAALESQSSFYVISCVLADLNLLNSELGRLAISSSMISGICSWTWVVILFTTKQSLKGGERASDTLLWMGLCVGTMVILIIFILRPIMFWMAGKTADGKAIKEGYIFAIFVMILGCSFFGEAIGQHFLLGPMILGFAVPDGPRIASALIERLDSYVSGILLPIFFVVIGAKINLSSIHLRNFGIVELLVLFSFISKLMGTMLPSLYCKMPVLDALSLGLIMCSQGITDILLLKHAINLHLIDEQSYSILIISMVLITGTITPIVKVLYKPSRRFASYNRRTIQHAIPDTELRILSCIYHEDSTPSIINLLEVSNPTAKSPICFYVVHLTELVGRSSPLLVAHRRGKNDSFYSHYSHHSDHIINAFRLYEKRNEGIAMVNPFTAISPYVTMHEDVCALALDKRASMVIVPFHKKWTIRTVNRNILSKSPCSVGILVDQGTLRNTNLILSKTLYSIGMIFLGGQDDREALAYAMRMGEHPNVSLTVVRFLESSRRSKYNIDIELDFDMINEFRLANYKGNKRHVYKEEVVKDCVEMISVIQSVENSFDLILVGRRHASESPLLVGLTEWNEFPELGFIGDILASSDSTCKVSVLVVQQQVFAGEDILSSPKYIMENSYAVMEMPPRVC